MNNIIAFIKWGGRNVYQKIVRFPHGVNTFSSWCKDIYNGVRDDIRKHPFRTFIAWIFVTALFIMGSIIIDATIVASMGGKELNLTLLCKIETAISTLFLIVTYIHTSYAVFMRERQDILDILKD